MSFLIYGPNIDSNNFTQPSLTVSQLVLQNFKQKYQNTANHAYRRSNRKLETSIQIYTSLSFYDTI